MSEFQGSNHPSDEESDDDYSDYDEEEDINDYYNNNEDFIDSDDDRNSNHFDQHGNPTNNNINRKKIQELEHFDFECLNKSQVEEKLAKDCETISRALGLSASLSQFVLQANKWKTVAISTRASIPSERTNMLQECGVILPPSKVPQKPLSINMSPRSKLTCNVCFDMYKASSLVSLECKHLFCHACWKLHFEFSIKDGIQSSKGISCMEKGCTLLCPEEFIHQFFSHDNKGDISLFSTYQSYLFQYNVQSHYQLRYCPGIDCEIVIYAELPKPRKVKCTQCSTVSCFECGNPYHMPTDCSSIRKWLNKCADDSETANYISANTKDCPKCQICIEKNGGCNHIKCSKCSYNFCWMCLGNWKNHGNSYYECSKYKEDPKIAVKNKQTHAREALKKYLFYFQRWDNHNQSLHLEAQAREKILSQIEDKVNKSEGTWIDWQYLSRAGELLAQCRYTLQYTYPLVFYAESGSDKTLFEYQQAQLEVEIEGLAWKLERAENYQRGDIENQMDICEKRRQTLLMKFVSV